MADAVIVGARGTGTDPITTTGGTTAGSGSSFLIVVIYSDAQTITSVTDSKSNTYTEVGTKESVASGAIRFYFCENGTGGAGHTATVDFSAGADGVVWLLEITGLAATPIDDQNITIDSATPYTITTATLAQADEIIIAATQVNTSNPTNWASSTMTVLDWEPDGASFYTGCVAKKIVAATTAFTCSFTETGSATSAGLKYVTLKIGAAAADTLMGQGMS